MPVWIPWLKVNQQSGKGGGGKSWEGGSGKGWEGGGGGKGWEGGGGKGWEGGGGNRWEGGKSWGKGWGKTGHIWQGAWGSKGGGKGKWQRERKPPQAVPESFQINSETRYAGTVKNYNKFRGFGFVDLAQKGVVPNDSMYVHWKSLRTEDRFPQLMQGMEVEISVMKVKDKFSGTWTLKAKDVTMPGGAALAVQDEIDAKEKQFVGGQHLRYTGQLQFFAPKRGFGWLAMDDGYALTEPVPKELRVDLPEVNAGGKQPPYMKEIAVEFGIMKDPRRGYKAYNMTLPGGIPMTQEGLEHRVVLGSRTFKGIVEMFSWMKGFGFIKAAPGAPLPPNVMAKVKQQQDEASKRGKNVQSTDVMLYFRRCDINEGVELDKGKEVVFKVYTDDKGAGACEIH